MINKFCKKPLWECSKTLSAVAQGLAPAETVIKGAKLVNVCTAEIQEDVDVAIAEGPHRLPRPGQTTASARTRRSSMRRGSTSRQGSSTGTSTWNRP